MLTFSHSNGIWRAKKGEQIVGQSKSMAGLLMLLAPGFHESTYFDSGELLERAYGPTGGENDQISTREP